MNRELHTFLRRHRGVITRADARAAHLSHLVDYAIRAGQLENVHRGVYAAKPVDDRIRRRAAFVYCRGRAAISHTTALATWLLHDVRDDEPIHVTIPSVTKIRARGLVVHRRDGFALDAAHVRSLDGLPTTVLEQTLVDCWPILPPERRREPVIRAVTDRRTTPARIRRVVDPRVTDKATLIGLLDLLAIGCHSPLEIWGHQHVFTGPGMPDFRRQVPVRLRSRTVYLDLYAEAEKVNIELDGDAVHASSADRERDLRRDAALAALGILVVRYTHHRLTHDPEGVRREVLAILAVRRGLPVGRY
jgi:very-short-patch-repair endonuclease